MKHQIFEMLIEARINHYYLIKLYDTKGEGYVLFSPEKKDLVFLERAGWINIFVENEYQLRKMLHNKRKTSYYKGFHLKFVFTEGKNIAAYNDRSKILVLDKRRLPYKNYVIEDKETKIHKLYTDASYMENACKGGIAFIIEDPDGIYALYHEAIAGNSSNLMELMAAVKGLEMLKDIEAIRIITDSQYVRKGLTEWIVYWTLNDWMTVNGEKAKNINIWQRINRLTLGKYIEFQWVKGHNNHFENTLCDLYAKDALK